MELFEEIADLMEGIHQSGFNWEKYNQISQKIESNAAELIAGLQSEAGQINSTELLSKTWDFLHAAFFLMAFSQSNPREALEQALSKFEPQIKAADEKIMTSLERQSFEEFKRVIDISRRLVNTK